MAIKKEIEYSIKNFLIAIIVSISILFICANASLYFASKNFINDYNFKQDVKQSRYFVIFSKELLKERSFMLLEAINPVKFNQKLLEEAKLNVDKLSDEIDEKLEKNNDKFKKIQIKLEEARYKFKPKKENYYKIFLAYSSILEEINEIILSTKNSASGKDLLYFAKYYNYVLKSFEFAQIRDFMLLKLFEKRKLNLEEESLFENILSKIDYNFDIKSALIKKELLKFDKELDDEISIYKINNLLKYLDFSYANWNNYFNDRIISKMAQSNIIYEIIMDNIAAKKHFLPFLFFLVLGILSWIIFIYFIRKIYFMYENRRSLSELLTQYLNYNAEDNTPQTRIKDIANLLKKSNDISQKIAKIKFIQSASHEIKNSLSNIIGFSELIKNSSQDKKINNYINKIQNQNEQIIRVVDNFMNIRQIINKDEKINLQTFDLRDLVDEILEISYKNLKARNLNIEIYMDFDPNITENVICDYHKFYTVLQTLLFDAVNLAPQNTNILLKIQKRLSEKNGFMKYDFSIIDKRINKNNFLLLTKLENWTDIIPNLNSSKNLALSVVRNYLLMCGSELFIKQKDNENIYFFELELEISHIKVHDFKNDFKDLDLALKINKNKPIFDLINKDLKYFGINIENNKSPKFIISDDENMLENCEKGILLTHESKTNNQEIIQLNYPVTIRKLAKAINISFGKLDKKFAFSKYKGKVFGFGSNKLNEVLNKTCEHLKFANFSPEDKFDFIFLELDEISQNDISKLEILKNQKNAKFIMVYKNIENTKFNEIFSWEESVEYPLNDMKIFEVLNKNTKEKIENMKDICIFRKNNTLNGIFSQMLNSFNEDYEVANSMESFYDLISKYAFKLLILDYEIEGLDFAKVKDKLNLKSSEFGFETKIILFSDEPENMSNEFKSNFDLIMKNNLSAREFEQIIKKFI